MRPGDYSFPAEPEPEATTSLSETATMGDDEQAFLDDLAVFLRRGYIQRLVKAHPNQIARSLTVLDEWRPWWDWAGQSEDGAPRWLVLWRFYAADNPDNDDFASIPVDLRHHVNEARRLQLSRKQGFEAKTPTNGGGYKMPTGGFRGPEMVSGFQDTQEQKGRPGGSTRGRGMSPKKLHEVESMSSFAATMLSSLAKRGTSIQHAVDVGAGQAYLSRALRDELGLHVLAVDWSAVQEQGAARREERKKCTHGPGSRVGSLTYRNVAITSDSLQSATDEWIRNAEQKPAPLLLVALHACGSLTLDILRTLLRRLKTPDSSWSPHAALIVGCCYNLLRPEDCTDQNGYGLAFSANHLQLAAQVPSQWGLSPAARKDAELAIRKVSWRAMLDRALDPSVCERRLGRVNDSAYRDWETFTSVAQEKLGVDTLTIPRDTRLESQLGVLHFLRCILGPVIESFLLLDRKLWVQRELEGSGLSVHLVNLFDQASGSARNVSIVVAPE